MKPKSALRERLEAAVMERHCVNHPLTEKWAAGKLSRNALMGWGIEQYHWISNIYRGELFKAANTPLEVQRLLLENYLEETDPARPHLDIILRFAAANGADIAQVKRSRGLPTTEAWVTFFNRVCKEESFIASVAATNVGTESQSPPLYSKVLPALRDIYRLKEEDIEHFWLHAVADTEHGGKGFDILDRYATTPELQDMAVNYARERADALVLFRWHLHPLRDGLQLALRKREGARTTLLKEEPMDRPRIRHIAINVEDREKAAQYYKDVFKLEEKERGPNGTIYLSDGFVDVALIKAPDLPWGIHHFGFVVASVKAIEEFVGTTANANVYGAIAESWIKDPEGNRVDISEHGWPV